MRKNPFDYRTYVYPMHDPTSLSLYPICRWVEDGSLVDDGSSYTNWQQSQPNGNGDCMVMFSSDGTWDDYDCGYPGLYAVCSKPIASTANATAAHNINRA